MIAPQYMNMIAVARSFKHTRNQEVVNIKGNPADGAFPRQIIFQTAKTAANVHQAVFASGEGREGYCFYLFSLFQLDRTDRANLRFAGASLIVFLSLSSPFPKGG